MEFVHLVTENTTLETRLCLQLMRLSDEARVQGIAPEELDALCIVSVASAYEARIDLRRLVAGIKLPDPLRTIALFEKEYLLRRSNDGAHLTGLHPVRSTIIARIMTDRVMRPWHAVAFRSLEFMVEDDLELFLLYTFKRRPEDKSVIHDSLRSWRPQTWTGLAGVWRALLWSGLEAYVDENSELLKDLWAKFSHGWNLILDFDVAGALPADFMESSSLFPDHAWGHIRDYRTRQTPKRRAYTDATRWITDTTQLPNPPKSDPDWAAVGEILFWSTRLEIQWPLIAELETLLTDQLADSLPLNALAGFCIGYAAAFPEPFSRWLDEKRMKLYERFRRETSTVKLDDDGAKLCAHFIVDQLREGPVDPRKRPDGLNGETMWRVELMRWLYPDRTYYGGQGYGHHLGHLSVPFDDTTKNIAAENFVPDFLVQVNALFRNLVNWRFRPVDWAEYIANMIATRSAFVGDIEELTRFFDRYLSGSISEVNSAPTLHAATPDSRWRPLYPKCAVDEWGFVSEDMPPQHTTGKRNEALILAKYAPYAKATKEALFAGKAFAGQITEASTLNLHVGKAASPEMAKQMLDAGERLGISKKPHLAFHNFVKALKSWPTFQIEFSRWFASTCENLAVLDRRENHAFNKFWPLLYYMMYEPARRFQKPLTDTASVISNERANIRLSLSRRLSQISESGILSSILDAGTDINGVPALWITYDTVSPLARERGIHAVLGAVHQELSKLKPTDLRWNVVNISWNFVYVLQLVQGKLLAHEAWRFDPMLIAATTPSQLEWYNFESVAVEPNVLSHLGIAVWNHPRLAHALSLVSSVTELWSVVTMLNGSIAISERDELGTGILQQHLDRYSLRLSSSYARAQEALRTMGTDVLSLKEQGRNQRKNFQHAVEMLFIVNDKVKPKPGADGEVNLVESDFGAWEKRLEEAKAAAALAQLYWAADVIKDLEKSNRSGRK